MILKTLKDFENWWNKNVGSVKSADFDTFLGELRQSAIEDIKELKQEAKRRDEKFGLRDIDKGTYVGKIEYIKLKFNITEEDMK